MDLICFSHLRWDFVFQRPQHLMLRFASLYRVFYMEEPVYHDGPDTLSVVNPNLNIWIVIPQLNKSVGTADINQRQQLLLKQFFELININPFIVWYYTPMALPIAPPLPADVIIYDCMDELSAFKFAPEGIKESEQNLFDKADLVFTGGYSLYEAKRKQHSSVYAFPSAIDKNHFAKARKSLSDPADQEKIPNPRFGFFGVIDERFDIDLINEVSAQKPDWHFVFIGPVVKIELSSLPQRPNIHYLGIKTYDELPEYLSNWDVAIIPFAINDSTRFISPTKTPEFLAAGKPVISTAIKDIVNSYGRSGLVSIINNADEFIEAGTQLLGTPPDQNWLSDVDAYLDNISWDKTWYEMHELILQAARKETHKSKTQKHNV